MNAASALAVLDPQSSAVAEAPRFAVPLAETAEFAAIAERRRMEVTIVLRLLARVHDLRGPSASLQTACATVAASSRHLMRGCSAQSLRRKYEAYLGARGDWRVLVAGYKGPATTPPAFDEYVKKLAEDNHRSMSAAFQLLLQQWRDGVSIPGYGTWFEYFIREYPAQPLPKVCPRSLIPTGWSQRTLYRKAPNKGARMLFQRGIAAAKKYFPCVIRDTSTLRPMEYIAIDDFELDCLCVFSGDESHKPQIGRVAGLLAIDVATRRKLHWGIGQRLERTEEQPDGTIKTVRTGIARIDVQLFLHGLFEKYGLPEYTVTIVCENAAAAISKELELAFSALFEGRVRVERTGLIHDRTLTNGFAQSGGKPWEKGWIESTFNGLWNVLGAMPGYKGNNQRLTGPADLDAKISYTKALIGHGEGKLNLPPEKIELLQLPFPSIKAVEMAFSWACSVHDSRTQHKCQGFDKVTEFDLGNGSDPVPLLALSTLTAAQQMAVIPIERMESPLERWSRISSSVSFRPIPPAALAILLLAPKKVTFRNHAFSFQHGKTGYSYIDRSGRLTDSLKEGVEYLAFFNPANPAQLHVTTLQGGLVGSLDRLGGARGAIDIRDKKALREEADAVRTIIAGELSQIRERHAEQNDQLALGDAHNEAIKQQHLAETKGFSTAEKVGLAAGANERARIEEAAAAKQMERERSSVERAALDRASKLTREDTGTFLDDPVAPASTGTTGEANASEGNDLADYL